MLYRNFLTFLALAFVASASIASAQEWDGDAGNPGDWNDATNWVGDTLPGVGGNVVVGGAVLPNATANISGSLSNPTINDFRIGADAAGGANGTVNQSAGSLTVQGWALIGIDSAAGNTGNTGSLNLSGTAAFDVDVTQNGGAQEFHVGLGGGTGASNQGFVTVADQASLFFPRGYIGTNDGNTGTMTQTGGSVTANDWLSVGRDGGATGLYTMSGGTLTITNDGLTIGENNGATGTMDVSGSSIIETPNLQVGRFGGGAEGTLSIDGSNVLLVTGNMRVGGDAAAETDTTGNIEFIADANGVSAITATGDLLLNTGASVGSSNLSVDLTADSDFALWGATGTLQEILLIDYAGALLGNFTGLTEGSIVDIGGGKTATISYVGGDGTDVVLQVFAVPEPSSMIVLGLGALALVSRRRRS